MKAATREILAESMVRSWDMVWVGVPGLRPESYTFVGTSSQAIDDFRRRFPFIPVSGSKLVMDDGNWTVRLVFADK